MACVYRISIQSADGETLEAILGAEDRSESVPHGDDGGSPRLGRDPVSGKKVLKWAYAPGDGLLEAAGLQVGAADSLTIFVVAASRSHGWPARGSKVCQSCPFSFVFSVTLCFLHV